MSSSVKKSLRKLSHAELKKQAKKSGVKVSMTADKIIASLLEKSNADEDSFVTLENTILNSCKKNKEALFERDSRKISETPRRETYVVETPVTGSKTIDNSIIMASASPDFKQSKDESLHVTMTRGSEKKNRKSKRKVSFVTPLRRSTRLSTATPQYNSVKGRPKTPLPSRQSSTKRVPVVAEVKESVPLKLDLDLSQTLETQKSSVDQANRPSTPMPSNETKRKLSSFGYSQGFELTPRVILHRLKEEDLISAKSINDTPVSAPDIKVTPISPPDIKVTPISSSDDIKMAKTETTDESLNAAPITQPDVKVTEAKVHSELKKSATPFAKSRKTKSAYAKSLTKVTPGITSSGAVRKSPRVNAVATTPKFTSSNVKKTPNFKELHQKNFDKMESILDYHQRKLLNSQKKTEQHKKFFNVAKANASKPKRTSIEKMKKAPGVFGGIPFIPSTATTKSTKTTLKSKLEMKKASSSQAKVINGRNLAKKATAGNVKAVKSVSKENTPLKQRQKFDLRASLARKLPYKPHTGPLKPLNETNLNNTMARAPLPSAKKIAETKNSVVSKARTQTREVLRGVRKNKRFMLQMNNRNLDMSVQ